jgi:hypothetical protein
MFNEVRKLISLKKRRLRDRKKWWEDLKISDIRAEKADKMIESIDRQRKLLTKMQKLLSEFNQLERESKITKVNADIKLEKLYNNR